MVCHLSAGLLPRSQTADFPGAPQTELVARTRIDDDHVFMDNEFRLVPAPAVLPVTASGRWLSRKRRSDAG